MTISANRIKIGLAVLAVLLVANFIYYYITSWGLITVKVKNAPIGQVIKSIERQGWVTIYSNIDPQTLITMYCDHVPLADAMETLAVNVEEPAPADANTTTSTDGGNRGNRAGRGGGFGGGAQWHLGFFVAPTAAQVKDEIRTFTEGADRDDDSLQTYNFPTMLNMISSDTSSVADPRLQVWPGVKLPPPPPPNPDGTVATGPDGNPIPPETAPTTVQGYLKAFARQADIWIIAPASWDVPVATAPAPNSSIISAIRHFVGSAHGSVTEAIILRGREQRRTTDTGTRPRGNGFRGAGLDLSMMEDRVDNAINGLPKAEQAPARAQLQTEKQFQKELSTMPWDQRRQRMMTHFIDRRMGADNSWRRSPEKRAQIYSRLVNGRIAATGK